MIESKVTRVCIVPCPFHLHPSRARAQTQTREEGEEGRENNVEIVCKWMNRDTYIVISIGIGMVSRGPCPSG